MMAVLSNYAVWVFMLGIVLYGMAKKVDCVNACIQGAEKGFHAYLRVLPTMLCMLSAIAVARQSGLLDAITGLLVVLLHERRTGGFETRAPLLGQVLKFTLGLALVAGVKAALKPAFYALLPAGPADCVRYFLVVLLAGCIFPKTFSYFAKLGKNREAR